MPTRPTRRPTGNGGTAAALVALGGPNTPWEDRCKLATVLRSSSSLFLPALLVAATYGLGLPQRTDYLGHFLAGWGATLAAVGVVLAVLPPALFVRLAPAVTLAVTLACLGCGALTEATVFRLAKWDEIDFCAQSLGAVLAGLGALAAWRQAKPHDAALWLAFVGAMLGLAGGFHFALE